MIRAKCPKCASPISLPESQAGATGSCPQCGQKFRVSAKQSAPPRGQPARADDDVQPFAMMPPPDRPLPPPLSEPPRRREDEDLEEVESDDGADTPRPKKRKKKKKKSAGVGMTGWHAALIALGVLVVLGATGILYYIQTGGSRKPKVDAEQVLAELKQIGAHVERDEKSPDRPVIGVTLTGTDFQGALLGRLSAFPQLRKLNLGNTNTSDVMLEHLEDVTTLKSLNLSHTKVTGGGLQFLKKMTELEELYLNSTIVTDVGLSELKGLSKLRRLSLDGTLAGGEELKEAIPSLEISK